MFDLQRPWRRTIFLGRPLSLRGLWVLTAALLVLLALWDASGLDLALARLSGTAQGFAWRSQPTFVALAHTWPRRLSSALLLALVAGCWRPWGVLRALAPAQRRQLALSVVLAMVAVALLKRWSATSCPWDLAEFGGAVRYVSHWRWGVYDLGPGHCFPAGHASAGFGFVAGWFVLRRARLPLAMPWLMAALAGGAALGLAQQVRGAHYMSHTLWSAWLCWALGLALDTAVQAAARARRARAAVEASPC
jgi:membrane-associated PAP2 superfamily phosphatase